MSKYTTEVRYICEVNAGLDESAGETSVETIIEKAIPNIFNFDFPIFDESYRFGLEKKILMHYYTREICEETVGLWKLRLKTKLNEIMPYYNQLYNSERLEFEPLLNQKVKRTGYDHDYNHELIDEETKNSKKDVVTTSNLNRYSDTPQGTVSNLEANTYLTNATKDDGTVETEYGKKTENDGDNTRENTKDYWETYEGYTSVSASKLLLEYRETFLNIDMLVINELEQLFMGLW